MSSDAANFALNRTLLELRVRGLRKTYSRQTAIWATGKSIVAADEIDFEIPSGKTLALVGPSGSGKSTVARCVTRLERPDAGEIWLGRTNIAGLSLAELRPHRTRIQMVFQDPSTSINPRFSAEEVIAEPLRVQGKGNREERRQRARELMKDVGLSPEWIGRNAMNFSGGQQQRIAIARALAVHPAVLVLDEALSALDLSTQAQIANLLIELQGALSLSYLLVSHDIALVSRMADTIAVMAEGKIVEQGPAAAIVSEPRHPATLALLESARASQANLEKVLGAHA
jgi:ABC-type glutathione transport system ATPase component